ncbi:MAG: YihY/virulence factor BrkB family protein [Candidatus Rokuibacteriota bacterium]
MSVRELARRVWNEVRADEVLDRSASLSYYFLFALFPALLFLTTLLGLLPWRLMDQLMEYVARVLPGDAAPLVQKTLVEIIWGAHPGLLSIGIAAALWTASSGMTAIMTALNIAFDVEDRRAWWRRRLIALALTVGFSILIPTALVLLIFGERMGQTLADWIGLGWAFRAIWQLLRWSAVLACVLTLVGLIYSLAPAGRRRWRWVTPGSIFAVAGWLVLSIALRLYVANYGNYNKTYGSIAGVILLLSWLYMTGVVLLVGAEIDSEIAAGQRETPRRA